MAGSMPRCEPRTCDFTTQASLTASRRGVDGELVGGLYGVAVGGLFAGESMFYRARDASKVALVALADGLQRRPSETDRCPVGDAAPALPRRASRPAPSIPAPPARPIEVPAPGHVPIRPLVRAATSPDGGSWCQEATDLRPGPPPAPSPPACRPPEAGVRHPRQRATRVVLGAPIDSCQRPTDAVADAATVGQCQTVRRADRLHTQFLQKIGGHQGVAGPGVDQDLDLYRPLAVEALQPQRSG